MKKIKSVSQLYLRQKMLLEKEIALEKLIKRDWKDLRSRLTVEKIGNDLVSEFVKSKEDKANQHGFLTTALSSVAEKVSEKLIQQAGKKIGKILG